MTKVLIYCEHCNRSFDFNGEDGEFIKDYGICLRCDDIRNDVDHELLIDAQELYDYR